MLEDERPLPVHASMCSFFTPHPVGGLALLARPAKLPGLWAPGTNERHQGHSSSIIV